MKRNHKIFAGLIGAFLAVGLLSTSLISTNKASQVDASTGSYSTDASTFYNSITATSGTSLALQLHQLMVNTHKTYTTYDDCKTPATVYGTDPGTSSSYVTDFYTQQNISKTWGSGANGTWNREHVWPQSQSNNLWGTSYGGSDMHHLRPVETKLNQLRGNNLFGELSDFSLSRDSYKIYSVNTSGSNLYHGGYNSDSNGVYEPLDSIKGDVARIVMYVYIHYNRSTVFGGSNLSAENNSYFGSIPITKIVKTKANTEAAAWALLLKWSSNDAVSTAETTRNNKAAYYQGNRNPFIDNPSYATSIWGSSSSVTLSLDKYSTSIAVNGSTTITATASGGSGSVSWSSGTTSVATVSPSTGTSTTVTGKAAGSSIISATYSGQTVTCTVTVTSSGQTETTYSQLTSISNINESAQYVLGVDGTGFHYSGTSSWGLTALPSAQTPLYYTLTKGSGNTTFTAETTISNTKYYLTVPTSKTFTMSTNSTSLAMDTGKILNNSDNSWVMRLNGSSGLRAYSSETGLVAYFYQVVQSAPTIHTISLSGDDVVEPGSTLSLTATHSGSDAISWSSDDTSVATVSNGVVTGVAEGVATITASCASGGSASLQITVAYPTDYKILFKDNGSDSGTAFTATTALSYISSGASYVSSVSDISRAYPGTVGVKFGSSDSSGTLKINLVSSAQINISAIKLGIKKYGTDTGKINLITNLNSTAQQFTPTSDLTEVEASLSGVISTITIGTSSKRGYLSYIQLVENSSGEPAHTITLSGSSSVNVSSSITLTASHDGEDAISWSSSSDSIATVDGGVVTGVGPGTATITASCPGGGYATKEVTVNAVSSGDEYKLVTTTDELISGSKVIIASEANSTYYVAKAYASGNNVPSVTASLSDSVMTPMAGYCAYTIDKITTGDYSGTYTFKDSNNKYLYAPTNSSASGNNYLKASTTLSSSSYWNITINGSSFSIVCNDSTKKGTMQFNAASGTVAFACYAEASQTAIQLYADVTAGVQAFVDGYMHLSDYTGDGTGLCLGENGYYYTAKGVLIPMGSAYINEFKNNSTFDSAQARYEKWAEKNHDSNPYVISSGSAFIESNNDNAGLVTTVITIIISAAALGSFIFVKKRKHDN